PVGAGVVERGASRSGQMRGGWWPGNAPYPDPAFSAYAYPKPAGIESAELASPGASWNHDLGEFILRYGDVRDAPSPEAAVRQFLDAAYDACASRSGWSPKLVG